MKQIFLLSMALVVGLSGCKTEKASGYIYSQDDPKYQLALADAKANYPKYFDALSESGSGEYFEGRQVFGKDVECVVFENYSSIIIEIDLPMYCFNKGTDILAAKL